MRIFNFTAKSSIALYAILSIFLSSCESKQDIQNDIETFETIDGLIHRLTWKTDDKLQRLQNLLDNEYLGKKILIFTELPYDR